MCLHCAHNPRCVMTDCVQVPGSQLKLAEVQKGHDRLTKLQSSVIHLPADPTRIKSQPRPATPRLSISPLYLPSPSRLPTQVHPKNPRFLSYKFSNPGGKEVLGSHEF